MFKRQSTAITFKYEGYVDEQRVAEYLSTMDSKKKTNLYGAMISAKSHLEMMLSYVRDSIEAASHTQETQELSKRLIHMTDRKALERRKENDEYLFMNNEEVFWCGADTTDATLITSARDIMILAGISSRNACKENEDIILVFIEKDKDTPHHFTVTATVVPAV